MEHDLDKLSGSLQSFSLVENFFNVHSVITATVKTPDIFVAESDTVSAAGRTWIALSSNSVKVDSGYLLSLYLIPALCKVVLAKVAPSVSTFKSAIGFSPTREASVENSWKEDLEFKSPFVGIIAAAALMRYRTQEFEKLCADGKPASLFSKENYFLYLNGVSLMSAKYKTMLATKDDSSKTTLNNIGVSLSYNDRTNLNYYLGMGSFPEKKKTFRLHMSTIFSKILTVQTNVPMKPFKNYTLEFVDKAIPKGDYFLYKQTFNPKKNPMYTHQLGVMQ